MAPYPDEETLEDYEVLLKDVHQVWLSGVPGSLVVFGPKAFPIVAGAANQSQKLFHAIFAGGRYGKGKIIAAPHDSFIHHAVPGPADVDRFILNCINWLAGPKKTIRVGHFRPLQSGFPSLLKQNGVEAVTLRWQDLTSSNLAPHDVLIISENFTAEKVPALASFVENGGGVLIAVTAWACRCSVEHPGTEFAPNLLAQRAGIAWTKSHIYTYPKSSTKIYDVPLKKIEFQHQKLLHFRRAFAHLQKITIDEDADDGRLDQCMQTITEAFSVRIGQNVVAASSYKDVVNLNQLGGKSVPSTATNWRDTIQQQILHLLSSVKTPENVSASSFEKLFLPEETTNRDEEKTIELVMSNKFSRWNSTGLFAPKGTLIEVTFQHKDNLHNYEVQIGYSKNALRTPVVRNQASVTSPNGGLIYIVIPEERKETNFKVSISGAIRAPFFKLRETSPDTWRLTNRFHSAPEAEFVTEKIIITVPTKVAKTVENPTEMLEFWDKALDACADLAGRPRDRRSPERIVADATISFSGVISGYPIITSLSCASPCVDVKNLKVEGAWGHFFALGQNHRQGSYTFDGTGSTTCNIFTLYIYDTIIGKSSVESSTNLRPEKSVSFMKKYIADGKSFDYWKSNPFLSLLFYIQLQQQYGWNAYKNVFSKYESMTGSQLPRTNQDKMDMWFIMFSEEVGENLHLFFESWAIPISKNAKTSQVLKDLPDASIRMENLLIGYGSTEAEESTTLANRVKNLFTRASKSK